MRRVSPEESARIITQLVIKGESCNTCKHYADRYGNCPWEPNARNERPNVNGIRICHKHSNSPLDVNSQQYSNDSALTHFLRPDRQGGKVMLAHDYNGLDIAFKSRFLSGMELIVNGMVFAEWNGVFALWTVALETHVENTHIKATWNGMLGGTKLFINGNKVDQGFSAIHGCYIATSVYHTYDCPQLWTLRRFRDDILENSLLGKLFVRIYYSISPTLVKQFGRKRWFNSLWRTILDSLVKRLQSSGIDSSPYIDK